MYNSNYNYWPGNSYTFHPTNIPPPPPPPKFFIPSNPKRMQEIGDREFLQSFQSRVRPNQAASPKQKITISQVFLQLRSIVMEIQQLKDKNVVLSNEISSISDEDWKLGLEEIEKNKLKINKMLTQFNDLNINNLKHLLAKRAVKRLRLRRVKSEKKMEKERKLKEMQETSRKIDEDLQKIKDEVMRAKREEEAKAQADIILKEVLRKKHDAKKCITKLDALMKLRKARQNTMKGRGKSVSESEGNLFNRNIEKLKLLWTQKLAIYDKEELELRKKLEQDSEDKSLAGKEIENKLVKNLAEWRLALFGGSAPQVDFKGDTARFIHVRRQWDKFINVEGAPIPVGWVPPTNTIHTVNKSSST